MLIGPDGGGVSSSPAPSTTPSAATSSTGGVHLSDQQVQSTAHHILSVGDRTLWTDDYDARMKAFAQEMGTLDANSAQRLLSQVMKDDSGATQSWLQGDRLLNDVSDPTQRAAVVDAFSADYVSGKTSDATNVQQALDFMTGGSGYSLTQGAMGVMSGGLQKLDAFLNAGDTQATDGLRQKLGEQLFQVATTSRQTDFNPSAAALGVHIMSGSSDPGMAARVYGELSASDRSTVFDQVSTFGNVYARMGQSDALSQLVSSVDYESTFPMAKTSNGNESYQDVGVDLIRQAYKDKALYPDPDNNTAVDPGRATAFSSLFIDNQSHVLNTMLDVRNTTDDPTVTAGSNPVTYEGEDGAALANLFRATALESKNPLQSSMLSSLSSYISSEKANARSSDPNVQASAYMHLGALSAVSENAVSQLQGDINADAASQKAFISFIVDTAFSALPAGDLAKAGATSVIENVFGSKVAQDLANNVSGSLIDTATGTLTDKAKDTLAKLLGPGGEDVASKITYSNDIKNMIFAGVGDAAVERLDNTYTDYQVAITSAEAVLGSGSGN